ncbi:M23 family metallopeptidase [bacterium]|nr:M23 family metallopeptidase [bacterium]
MRLKKHYNFLYMPEDESSSRAFRIPRWALLGALGFVGLFLVLAVMVTLGFSTGAYWRPGGAPLQKENLQLHRTIAGLEGRVLALRQEIDSVFEVQNLMAATLDLPVLDRETFAAGVGGRAALEAGTGLIASTGEGAADAGRDLDQMLRQARIQRQGYLSMLDTLASRATLRAHIPSVRPADIGWVSSGFGFRDDPFTGRQTFHRGLDFSLPVGTPVRATAAGVVLVVQQQRGFGRVVKIDHGNGVVTLYAHLDKALVKKGDKVERGDAIALSGNTGRSSAPHLHYEVHLDGRPVNPAAYVLDSYILRS